MRGSVLAPRALYLRPVGFPGFASGSGRHFASAGAYRVEAFRKAEGKLIPVTPGSFLDPRFRSERENSGRGNARD